jgi:hypothetical protein
VDGGDVTDVLAGLAGSWRFTRSFDPGIGTMLGQALFTPVDAETLHYREDGQLVLADGQRSQAWREYRYLRDGDVVRVCFLDGRTLHALRFEEGQGESSDVHYCIADVYTGHYRFALPNRFEITMTVRGPRKNYTIDTVYTRADSTG